jgi:hypothetical protein
MIITETVVINSKQFIKTYSSENKYIECDGMRYSEAFDLAEIGREYIETDILIEADTEVTEASDYEKIIDILTGNEEVSE